MVVFFFWKNENFPLQKGPQTRNSSFKKKKKKSPFAEGKVKLRPPFFFKSFLKKVFFRKKNYQKPKGKLFPKNTKIPKKALEIKN